MVSPFTTQAATAIVARTKIAPDGSFVAIALRGGESVRIRGRLNGSKLSGGLVEMSLGTCTGRGKFTAAALG